MPKSDLRLDSGEYAPVADRISLFYAAHPTGRILTRLVERTDDVVVFRASVYRQADDPHPAATGWASERIGDGDVNAVACLENTETSAIGRALANLGFTASARRPSAEEMAKASRERARLATVTVAPEAPRRPAERRTYAPSTPPARAPLRVAEPASTPGTASDARNALLDDVRDLVAEAERAGLEPARALRLRSQLLPDRLTPLALERVERGLRRWLARRSDDSPPSPKIESP